MSNKTYDVLRFIALIIAPIIVFATALVSIWNIPYAEQITATLAALDVLFGAIVEIARKIYANKTAVSDKEA